jgi:hypothetical protein
VPVNIRLVQLPVSKAARFDNRLVTPTVSMDEGFPELAIAKSIKGRNTGIKL